MKNIFTLLVFLLFVFAVSAQGLWQQKATCPTNNKGSVSFAINSVGYMYTGDAANNFYQYDPATNTWLAKASFPGIARSDAAGFATDSFGYIGTGTSLGTSLSDFYRYDPMADNWAAKANYPDTLSEAFAFCISNTGYFAGGDRGINGGGASPRCFAYNPSLDSWSQIDSLPLAMRSGFSAVVGGKAYCGLPAANVGSVHLDSVYEYSPGTNTWQPQAPYHLTNASYSTVYSFVINNLIYVSDANAFTGTHGAVGIFDPAGNSWSSVNGYPYPSGTCDQFHSALCGITIGNRGFMGNVDNCQGVSFWEYDPANHFAITGLTPDTLCEGESITVTFSSSLTFNAGNHFKLKMNATSYFANSGTTDSVAGTTSGSYTFKVPKAITTAAVSLDELALYSTDPVAQASYVSTKVFVKRAPVSGPPFASDYWHCAGSALLLYRSNAANESHYWSSKPSGILDTTQILSLTPTSTTTIYVTDVYNFSGCSLSDSTIVHYATLPSLQIADSSFTVCPGGTINIGGTAVFNGSYAWTSGGFSSSAVNPAVSPLTNTTYHVVLTDTTTACSVSGNTLVSLAQSPQQNICFVTVDSASTHNVVIWQKANRQATDSFYIYREISTNNYQRVGAVHGDSLSEFHDYAANPNITGYRYKISANDTCVNEGVLSPYHNTIHLQYVGTGNLIWNVYDIENDTTPVNSFDVMRDSLANGNWQVMVNVPGNQHTATDINWSMHPNALYRIVANWAYNCTASRSSGNEVLSNILHITGTGIGGAEEGSEIQLYPNPAKNELIINSVNSVEQVRIISMDGKVMMTSQLLNKLLDVSRLAAGVYIAEVKTKSASVVKRWVKM